MVKKDVLGKDALPKVQILSTID